MANPQVENGFTRIANEILEALIQARLSGREWKLVMYVIRKTYGFHKKADLISLSQFSKGTRINRFHACSLLKQLVVKKILNSTVTVEGNRGTVSYSLQKDYTKWRLLPKKVTVTEKGNSTVTEKGNSLLPKKVTTKDTLTKDKYKDIRKILSSKPDTENVDNLTIPYKEIIDDLNEVACTHYRSDTGKTKELIRARWKEGFRLEDFKAVHMKKTQDWGYDPKMCKFLRPVTLYSAGKFEGYLNERGEIPSDNVSEKTRATILNIAKVEKAYENNRHREITFDADGNVQQGTESGDDPFI